jgi:hypothetical protein
LQQFCEISVDGGASGHWTDAREAYKEESFYYASIIEVVVMSYSRGEIYAYWDSMSGRLIIYFSGRQSRYCDGIHDCAGHSFNLNEAKKLKTIFEKYIRDVESEFFIPSSFLCFMKQYAATEPISDLLVLETERKWKLVSRTSPKRQP